MVAFDHRRRKHRLTLGEYQGPTKSQLVLALSSALPRQLLDRSSIPSQRRSAPSSPTPLTLSNIPPFGVYFCRMPTLTALRDGIHPLPNVLGQAIRSIFLLNFRPPYKLQCQTRLTTPLSTNSAMAYTCLSIFQPLLTLGSRGICSTPKKVSLVRPRSPPFSTAHLPLNLGR